MLAPYSVLDLTDGRAALATFILAGLGADVIKVEPSPGCATRSEDAWGLSFQAYNRGKRSVVLDLDQPQGRCDFLALVATADLVFENAGAGVMDGRGLGFEVLREVCPDLVYVAISPFGQTGPYANHQATDLTLAAMGGAMALNGDRDRRPVRVTVPQTWHHAAAESAVGALVALQRRLVTGKPQFVDMSVQTAVFWTGLNAMISSAIDGRNLERGGTQLQLSTVTAELAYPCADGEVCMFFLGATLLGLVPWMVETEVVTEKWVAQEDWHTYEQRLLTGELVTISVEDLRGRILEFTKRYTKAEIFAGAVARGITIVPVNTAADIVSAEQLRVRGYWDELQLATGETVRAPGPFARVSNSPVQWDRVAPELGEHTDELLSSLADSATPVSPSPVRVKRGGLPLEGVKVADFSWIDVGPITAKALADHGATVIHIESEARPDRLRLVGPFKDDVAGINRCQFFGSFNTSKLSLHLDLKHPVGNEVVVRQL